MTMQEFDAGNERATRRCEVYGVAGWGAEVKISRFGREKHEADEDRKREREGERDM